MDIKKILLVFILFSAFLFPVFSYAQEDLCPVCSKPGGIVPCGRACDDPATLYKNECDPCTLCDVFEAINRIVDLFVLRIAPLIAILVIIIAGLIMMASYMGRIGPNLVSRAKKILWSAIIGLALIYFSWIIINTTFTALGVMSWTGLDEWWIVNCPGVSTEEVIRPAVCGDGIIQSPNDEGAHEVCDGINTGIESCRSLGFDRGVLKCSPDCLSFDTSLCVRDTTYTSASFDLPFPPPLNPPEWTDAEAPPDRCNECGTWLLLDRNKLGICPEEVCYALGDCNWSPVREIDPLVIFTTGGMCFFENDCSACGSAIEHECTYGECRAIGLECEYVGNPIPYKVRQQEEEDPEPPGVCLHKSEI